MNNALKETYEKEGYLLGVPILTPEEVKFYCEVYDRLDRETTQRSAKGRITNQHFTDPDLYALATSKKVLDLAELALGPDLILLSSGFFVKKPGATTEFVAWHQDTMYWGLKPPLAATVWIAFDDSDVENGCMRVIPRTHLNGLLPHNISKVAGNILGHNQEIPAEHIDESQAVDFVLKAGYASLHHGELVHGSNPNRSTRRRCGMTVRFTAPEVEPIMDGPYPFNEKPMLVRGEDRHGNFNLFEPSHAA